MQFQIPESARVAPAAGYVITHNLMGWPWGTFASMAAFLYSAIMIGEWTWRKVKAWRTKRQIRLDDEARKRTRRVIGKLDAKRETNASPE